MCKLHRIFNLNEDSGEEINSKYEDADTALTAPGTGWVKFQGICYNCSNTGQLAHAFPEKKN